MIVKYRINDVIPEQLKDVEQNEPLQNSAVNKAIVHTQRVVEGQIFDSKLTLSKYSYVADDQRKIVHKKRENILRDIDVFSVFEKMDSDGYRELLKQIPESEYLRAQKEIELFAMNKCWADHLLIIKDGHIDLNTMGVKGPSSTRTYLVHDGTELQSSMNVIAVSAVAAPMYTLYMLFARFMRRDKGSLL